MSKPYGLGHHGHANICDCDMCARARVKFAMRQWQDPVVPLPDPTRTVYVRAHWRAQPNHLKNYPNTLKQLKRALREARYGSNEKRSA